MVESKDSQGVSNAGNDFAKMKENETYEEQYSAEQLRSMKQGYLKANVMDEGYDLAAFGQFMEYKMGK